MRIADIHNFKNGKKRVDFFHLGVYELIKNELNFRFTKIDGKGYYFEFLNGVFIKSSFYRMQDALINTFKNQFETLEINGEIEHIEFLNAYYRKSPLTNGNFAKTFLSRDFALTDKELYLFKMETDFAYGYEVERGKMKEFLKQENFTKTIDRIGNFSKDGELYYKRITDKNFLVLNCPTYNSKKTIYDLWKIQTSDEKHFLNKKNGQIEPIMIGFNLTRDVALYEKEKRVATKN